MGTGISLPVTPGERKARPTPTQGPRPKEVGVPSIVPLGPGGVIRELPSTYPLFVFVCQSLTSKSQGRRSLRKETGALFVGPLNRHNLGGLGRCVSLRLGQVLAGKGRCQKMNQDQVPGGTLRQVEKGEIWRVKGFCRRVLRTI